MFLVTVFVVAAVGVLAAFYIRYRIRSFNELVYARMPAGELYRERMCLFIMQGYRAARAEGNLTDAWVSKRITEIMIKAGFVPTSSFKRQAAGFVKHGGPMKLDHLIDEWTELYASVGASDPEQWAIRRAAGIWAERVFHGPFDPSRTWKTYPSVMPSVRHVERRDKWLASQRLKQKGQIDAVEEVRPPPAIDLSTPERKYLHALHIAAVGHMQLVMMLKPLATDDEVAQRFIAEEAARLEARSGEVFARNTRSHFTDNRLKDIIAEKAFAVRYCAIKAIGIRGEQDPDASDNWIGELAEQLAHEALPMQREALFKDFTANIAAAYAYLWRASRLPASAWMDRELGALNVARVERIARLGTAEDHRHFGDLAPTA